ncbi:monovalent cation/H(+) antiporter subunit G [Lederbergia lenta]|uniref:monovalent cation/H(+) antiporter subunit G n=1 Tax=Lederbergia lenta TaxID=1467 RepID=UPI00203D2966|nr:monovalent cation/H(+) antiporter subunit G [Lederbergia lenta]MCM3113497.1 monovalent cation/H(+) antiporter subunit G [Lederbergia lenta]
MSAVAEWTIVICIIIGTFLSIVAAFGVLKLPDVYTRNHAASKSTTLGVLLTLLGTLIYFYATDGEFNARIVLGIVFIFITAPVAGHLISRAAYHTGVELSERSVQDDLSQKK